MMENIASIFVGIGIFLMVMSGVFLTKVILSLRRVVPTNMVHIVQSK